MIEHYLIPSGFFLNSGNNESYVSFLPVEPEMHTSPEGNEVPVYDAYPRDTDSYNETALSRKASIIYPKVIDFLYDFETRALEYNSRVKEARNDSSIKISRPKIVSVSDLFHAIYTEAYIRTPDPTRTNKLNYLAEELEHYDARKMAEKRLGRKIIDAIKGEEVEKIKAILKPTSYLYKKLESIANNDEKETFANAIDEIRAKLGTLRKSSSTPTLSLTDAMYFGEVDQEIASLEAPHYKVARTEIKKLMAEKLFSKQADSVTNSDWFAFFDVNIAKEFSSGGKSDTDNLIDKMHVASQSILEEHFYLAV